MISRLKDLEAENSRLKGMYADAQLDAQILKEALAKNGEAICTQANGLTSTVLSY